MTAPNPSPSSVPSTATARPAAHPLPLVRHHREGGDEPTRGALLLFRVCGAWNTAPETGSDLYAQERSALLAVADWLDEQQRDYAGHSFSRAARLIREELDR